MTVVRPSLSSVVCEKTSLLKYLLARCKAKRFDEVKGYAAEVLAILLAAVAGWGASAAFQRLRL